MMDIVSTETNQLSIKVEDGHISVSPSSSVELSSKKLILTVDGVKAPCGVALGRRGEVIVGENGGHCVSIFSSSHGKKLQSFGTYGSDREKFNIPQGVAADNEMNILVADSGNARIQKFRGSDLYLLNLTKNGLFSCPCDIAFNSINDKIYVVDFANGCVTILNSDLTFSNSFGKKGGGNGEFSHPCAIACDNTGKVYVADTFNHRIQVFTAEGTFTGMFEKRGENIEYPTGIAIDANHDLVYVSESVSHHISVFTSEGQFVSTFGKRGSGPGEFYCPNGLAVSADGILYVCDTNNNRVQCFK